VRKIIADEVTALSALPEPDITGMALRLGSLAESAAQLPLTNQRRIATATREAAESSPANWRDLPQAVWNDLKSLVQVRRHQQPIEPLLPPEQVWFLRENLRLKLEQARLALLRRNTILFQQTLDEAKEWINSFFDAQTPAVVSTLDALANLAGTELQPPMPDVSGSLRALRERRVQQQALGGAGQP
jgi:uroporphyrin-3 C-methyltransferase